MKHPIKSFFFLTAFASAALIYSCSNGASSPSGNDSPTKGSITGVARYTGLSSASSGIVVSAELTSSGKTASVRALLGRSLSGSRAVAAQATTDSSGAYALSDLAAGTYTVYASSKDSLEKALTTNVIVTAGKSVTASDLTLTPTGSIAGTATLDGGATVGIVVYIAGTSYAAHTDSAGAYTISSVPVGADYALYAEKGTYDAVAVVAPLDPPAPEADAPALAEVSTEPLHAPTAAETRSVAAIPT
jgi:hypothetical protein